jgi:predicted nucleic acid-binding protein
MIVIADTSPLNYLILVGEVDVLSTLFPRVVVPQTVAAELADARAPLSVRNWIANSPGWLSILPDPHPDPTLQMLDPGERAAITLALALNASLVLIDDRAGRVEAERRNLTVTGTLGILIAAHRKALLDFDTVVRKLSETPFYVSPRVLAACRPLL